MSRTKFKWLLIACLVILAGAWGMGQYDYSRLVAGRLPLFARFQLHLADGGSVQYLGLGYTVTEVHEMRWGIEMQTDIRTSDAFKNASFAPFRVGQTLDYWTPFVSREHTRFIVETNK